MHSFTWLCLTINASEFQLTPLGGNTFYIPLLITVYRLLIDGQNIAMTSQEDFEQGKIKLRRLRDGTIHWWVELFNNSKPVVTYLIIDFLSFYIDLRVQNEQFSEEKGFILRYTEKEA